MLHATQDVLLLGGHNGMEWLDTMHFYAPDTGTIMDAGRLRACRPDIMHAVAPAGLDPH